jgi:hypothetical protein
MCVSTSYGKSCQKIKNVLTVSIQCTYICQVNLATMHSNPLSNISIKTQVEINLIKKVNEVFVVGYFSNKCAEEKSKKISEGELLEFISDEKLNTFISNVEDGTEKTYPAVECLNDNLELVVTEYLNQKKQ